MKTENLGALFPHIHMRKYMQNLFSTFHPLQNQNSYSFLSPIRITSGERFINLIGDVFLFLCSHKYNTQHNRFSDNR